MLSYHCSSSEFLATIFFGSYKNFKSYDKCADNAAVNLATRDYQRAQHQVTM